jgi:predicted aldo/keto reductase-like oxidoreductase
MKNKKGGYTRREFLSRAVSGFASAGIVTVSGNKLLSSDKENSLIPEKKEIIYRTLGKTGIRMPVVNMGVMNSLDPILVKKSYENGIRYFDTSATYMRGRNEEMLGKVFKELNVRGQVIIGTKVFIPHELRKMNPKEAKEEYLKIASESLKRLQTDYVDILYSHNVSDLEWLSNPGIIEALNLLKQQKKVRCIGFSTHRNMVECINDAIKTGVYDVIETAFNYSMCQYQELITTLKNAHDKGIGLIAMKTQCKQSWYNENFPADTQEKYFEGKIVHKAILKWVLQHEFITSAIPGFTSFRELEEDFSVAFDINYTEDERKFLEDRQVKLLMGKTCQQCDGCAGTCPRGVDIPELMRVHMYAVCYSNFYQAKDTLNEIPETRGLDICSSCDTCVARCVNHVNIPGRIEELKTIYT